MNLFLLKVIISKLDSTSYHKFRNRRIANKIMKLIEEYEKTTDVDVKFKNTRTINGYLNKVFEDCLSKKSREELYSLSCTISEYCYQIEHDNLNYFSINDDGVKRYYIKNNVVVDKKFITREYKKGFILLDGVTIHADEYDEFKVHREFYDKYFDHLDIISHFMDRKEELISGGYELASKRINRELPELIVDYLDLDRIKNIKKSNEDVKSLKKTNEN